MRFLLIDRLVALEPGRRASARITFRADADIFADHFPGFPLVPGVLLTEAMSQTGGWLLVATSGFARWPLLSMIHEAKFLKQVLPGDDVDIEAELRGVQTRAAEISATASVRGQRVARARLLFHEIDTPREGPGAEDFRQWSEQVFCDLGGRDLLAQGPAGGHGHA